MTIITNIDPDTEWAARAFIAKVAANFNLVSPVGCADRKEAHQSSDSLKTGKQTK